MKVRTGLGQASKRFLTSDTAKPCVIGGVIYEEVPGFQAPTDGDVIYYALCRAITSLTGTPILCGLADDWLAKEGITDSLVYVQRGLELLGKQRISHVAISLEGMRPRFGVQQMQMRQNVASALGISMDQVGITAITGEGLTNVGCGDGVSATCILTTEEGG